MDYSREIEKLHKQVLEKNVDTDKSVVSKTHMIELYIDVNRSTFSAQEYYFYILGPLKGLLLIDNIHLHITKYELFEKFWDLAQRDVTAYYNCWISKITDDEKKELMGKQNSIDYLVRSPIYFDIEKKR